MHRYLGVNDTFDIVKNCLCGFRVQYADKVCLFSRDPPVLWSSASLSMKLWAHTLLFHQWAVMLSK